MENHELFVKTLKERVALCFTHPPRPQTGTSALYFKTTFWLLSWFTLFFLIYSPFVHGWIKLSILCPLLGISSAGIGFNIMHDASHKAYSEKKDLNTLFAFTLELVGPSSFMWFTKHVTIHHTLVNTEHDDDIVTNGLIVMSPHQERKWYHKYQHLYAPFLYGLLAIQWIYIADYRKYYTSKVHTRRLPDMKKKDHLIFWSAKICNLIFFIILPVYLFEPIALVGLFIYLFVVGLIISVIFQLAHVHEHAVFEQATEKGKLVKNFYVHQVYETMDFSTKNKVLTWLLGGLNFQVVHHLFPNMSHVHYPEIQPIVKKTCQEFNIPYIEVTFLEAIKSHFSHLKKMGAGV